MYPVSKTWHDPATPLSRSPVSSLVSSGLSKLILSINSFPFLEFDLLLKSEDVLLVDKVNKPEVFVEHAAVVFDARLEVGDAHILVAISLQGAQEGLFSEAGDLF